MATASATNGAAAVTFVGVVALLLGVLTLKLQNWLPLPYTALLLVYNLPLLVGTADQSWETLFCPHSCRWTCAGVCAGPPACQNCTPGVVSFEMEQSERRNAQPVLIDLLLSKLGL